MSFVEESGSLRSRLHASGLPTPLAVGIVALAILLAALACLNAAGVFGGGFVVEKADVQAAEAEDGEQAGSGEAAQATAKVNVHVTGAVVAPGVYALDEGARVVDAIAAAGGLAEDADEASVNQARQLQDGEQVVIAALGQEGDAQGAGDDSAAASSAASGLVNINTATAAQLETLPGIGEATAKKIIADREANGSFSQVEDLMRVSGIGEKKFEALSGLICV